MRFRITLLFILIVVLAVPLLVYADLSTLGQNLDSSGTNYLSSNKANPPTSYHTIKHYDTGSSWIYLTAYRVSGGQTRIYSYEVSYTGTLSGTSELYNRDMVLSFVGDAYAIVLVDDSVNPKLYSLVYRDTGSLAVRMVTFTVTNAGVISDFIDRDYIHDPTGGDIFGLDAFRVSNGVLCAEYTFDYGGATQYHYVRTVSVTSAGTITGIINSGTLGSSALTRGELKVFPLSGSANGSSDVEGAGWWGSVCRKTSNPKTTWLSTYNVSSAGVLTINAGEVQFLTVYSYTNGIGPAVQVNGSTDLYLLASNDSADEDWLNTFRISTGGVITAAPVYSYNWEPTPDTEVTSPHVLVLGGDRYAIVYYAGAGKGIRTSTFQIGSDGALAGSLVGDEQLSTDEPLGSLWSFHKTSNDPYDPTWLMEYPYSATDARLRTFRYYMPPIVTTVGYESVRDTTASGLGYLASCGEACPTITGVAWSSTDTSPSLSGSSASTAGVYPVDSSWSEGMTGLAAATTYYFRPYATSTEGTGYGTMDSFLTTAIFTNKQVELDFSASNIIKGSLVIEDLTINGNDAIVELAPMDSDITLSIGILTQNINYAPPGSGEASLEGMFDPVSQPDSMYQEGRGQNLPVYDLVERAADGMGWSTNRLYSFVMVVTAIGVGLGAVIATGSALLGTAACGIVMFAAVGTGVLPFWIVLVYILWVTSYLVASKSM